MSGKGKSKKASFKERKGITYQQGSDPPFIAQFKSKIGYKEWTVEDKFATSDEEGAGPSVDDSDDILKMREVERPQVVVVDPSTDLSAEQLQREIERDREEEDKRKILEGKIVFRKPEKRSIEEEGSQEEAKTDGKRVRKEEGGQENRVRNEEGVRGRAKTDGKCVRKEEPETSTQQQNRRLLSFGEDDDE